MWKVQPQKQNLGQQKHQKHVQCLLVQDTLLGRNDPPVHIPEIPDALLREGVGDCVEVRSLYLHME